MLWASVMEIGSIFSSWLKRRPNLSALLVLVAVFGLINWRLFAFGSSEHLFVYGDVLVLFNNLHYLFHHLNPAHLFNTFIGQHGQMGSYPMSDPQASIFYPPLAGLFVIFKLNK